MPYSPMSNAFLKTTVGFVSAYGIVSSAIESRCAIGRGARAVAGVECELVQREGLARVEADAQAPWPPAQRTTVEHEARALGLRDLDRAQIVAIGPAAAVAVVAVLLGHRQDAVVVDADDLHRAEVDEREQAADRSRVAVVAREIAAQPRERPAHAAGAVLEQADRPGVDHDELELVDPAQRQRGAEAGIGLDGELGLGVLVGRDGSLDARHRLEGQESLAAEVDDRLVGHPAREHDERRLARRGRSAAAPRPRAPACPARAPRWRRSARHRPARARSAHRRRRARSLRR